MASTYINRAFSSSSASTKATWSYWLKLNDVTSSNENFVFATRDANNNNYRTYFRINNDRSFAVLMYDASGNQLFNKQTSRMFRDPNAWYHVVYRLDTTQGSADDRLRLYVNNVQETSFTTNTQSSQNATVRTVSSVSTAWGHNAPSGGAYLNGILSHVHFTEGYSYAPTEFGETDATTGEWKIKTSPSVTYGSNGYFILKDGNSVTDASPNTNNFTVGAGTLTKTEDCPSNVFCTLNPLSQDISAYASGNAGVIDIQNGNTFGNKVTHGAYLGTIGVSSGKYYWEVKVGDTNQAIGIVAMRPTGGVTYLYDDATANLYYPYSDYYYTNGSAGSSGSGDFDNTSNKIYSFALDATNNKLWIGRDGTFVGDPANGTGATWASLPTGHEWTPVMHSMSTSQNNYAYFNFGNGYFGTTAVASAGTNASGNGIFEYNVPTGFTALSTKGLNL